MEETRVGEACSGTPGRGGGQGDLQREVLEAGRCTACGMCVGLCPYIKSVRDRVAVIHPCGVEEGACYAVCPRTPERPVTSGQAGDEPAAKSQVVDDPVLGLHLALLYARATSPPVAARGQYGGTVTALVLAALRTGEIDLALLTGPGSAPHYFPRPVLARNREEVLACAGSRYVAVPGLALLNDRWRRRGATEPLAGLSHPGERLGVIGRPCQVRAVRQAQRLQAGPAEPVGLTVGLFCFWALSADFHRFLGARVNLGKVSRIDVPKDGLEVRTREGRVYRWPVEDVRPYIRPACQACADSTAEAADLAVGSTEHDPGWNTLIVRTPRGGELVERAAREGQLEVKPYPAERLEILRAAVLGKKERVARQAGAAGTGEPAVAGGGEPAAEGGGAG